MTFALATLVLLGHAAAADPVAQARAAEEKAFAAVEEKRWCDALRLFVAADELAPSIDLALNAAQAAEMGGDGARALSLYGGVLGRNPDATQRAAVRKRIDAVARKLETDPGVACPAPVSMAPAEQAPPPVDVVTVKDMVPAVTPPPPSSRGSRFPWLAGGGAVVAVAGAVALGIGAQPYLLHEDAAAAIRAHESNGALDDARARQNDVANAARDWQAWGQGTAIAGAVGIAVGAVVGGVGLALALMQDPS
jgi:hypothetical protein